MKKRILAFLLAVSIAVSMLVLPASAAGNANTAVQLSITLNAMDSSQQAALNAVVTRGALARMLVSVTERTREIGIRKALGAKERVILSQFVVEAATTSALGGVLGIVLGYIVSMAANRILPMISSSIDVTVSPSFNSIVVAFGISVGIGVLFGYLPAKRAARLNPIEALRYD